MAIKVGKRKTTGKRPHLYRENASPAIQAHRDKENFLLVVRSQLGKNRKDKILSEMTKDVLNRQVIVNGEPTDITVAEQIVTQRALEAMQPNDDRNLALAATELLFDRSEGRAVSKQEISGPDGAPIETVSEHRVLAKLFS